jgi:hypothetical protein
MPTLTNLAMADRLSPPSLLFLSNFHLIKAELSSPPINSPPSFTVSPPSSTAFLRSPVSSMAPLRQALIKSKALMAQLRQQLYKFEALAVLHRHRPHLLKLLSSVSLELLFRLTLPLLSGPLLRQVRSCKLYLHLFQERSRRSKLARRLSRPNLNLYSIIKFKETNLLLP